MRRFNNYLRYVESGGVPTCSPCLVMLLATKETNQHNCTYEVLLLASWVKGVDAVLSSIDREPRVCACVGVGGRGTPRPLL